MSSVKNCGKSSAFKTVKGFTVLELVIVIAIIAILAGISSIAIQGFVRDANLETADNKAQQVYTAVQNMMIQTEIKQNGKEIFDKSFLSSGTESSPAKTYVCLDFMMENGEIVPITTGTTDKEIRLFDNVSDTSPYSIIWKSAPSSAAEKRNRKAFDFFEKYLCNNLSEEFTGYCYVCIDLDDYTVVSTVFTEAYDRVKNQPGVSTVNPITNSMFTKTYTYAGDKSYSVISCDGIVKTVKGDVTQKDFYKKTGICIGYYPMANDVSTF